MLFHRALIPILVGMLSLYASQARGGASLFVDDAGLTPAGRCQVESWVRLYRPAYELDAVPACTVHGIEWSLGVTRSGNPSQGTSLGPGIKRVFRDFDTHDWGVAMSLGANWDSRGRGLDGWNANVPASFALDAGRRVILNTNLGWTKTPGRRGTVTGGAGLEVALGERWIVLAEAYRANRFAGQVGIRRNLGENVSFDMLAGTGRGTGRPSWITFGLNILLPD
ncbi:hypothetical protein [Luteibacter yeojuensis]|uniref:Outer membrane beta-barrel porin/alpha-amylase n=1 Tax=Luteibacter yeojuensis TaxID=345309 RepID=A0A7X5QRM9_9GAMM|nr:hypothetical protein [Luteibacter yeojuensis]NID14099.1 hypothetical protein [Luteibacter yeojuensis]